MAFLDKNGLQTLTNKLTQGDAIKVASHRGHTVTNVIDNIKRECDNISTPNTMKIENNIPNFKIGQGVDLDVSGDVEEGKVEVELKGKTYQNLLDDSGWLHIEKTITSNHSNNVALTSTSFLGKSNLMKPSTKYTLILNFDISLNTLKNTYLQINYEYEPNKQAMLVHIGSVSAFFKNGGEYKVSFITPENFQRVAQVFIGGYGGTLTIKSNGMTILEGDHTQTPAEELPQYFEGIKSSFEDGIVDVEVQGKNLFSNLLSHSSCLTNIDIDTINLDNSSFATKPLNGYDIFCFANINNYSDLAHSLEDIEPNQYYTISFELRKKGAGNINYISIFGFKDIGAKYQTVAQFGNFYGAGEEYKKFSKTIKSKYFKDLKYFTFASQVTAEASGTVFEFKNVQIEKLRNQSQFEPYYKKKISFNIGEPLRSLPNGIGDEIRNNNGQWELIRRVGTYAFTGNEGWFDTKMANRNKTRVFACTKVFPTSYSENKILCNNFSHLPNIWDDLSDREGIVNDREKVMIAINTTKLSNIGWSAFCDWLAKNPTTLYHELATPIVTPIEPIEFDIKPLASININSHIIPTSTHSVELNRASQIERGIVEIAKLKERVDALEVAYDSHFIETQHKLSLLGLEYEIEGGNY